MNIGYKIKTLRVAKNLTQEELADRAELSKGFADSTVQMYNEKVEIIQDFTNQVVELEKQVEKTPSKTTWFSSKDTLTIF